MFSFLGINAQMDLSFTHKNKLPRRSLSYTRSLIEKILSHWEDTVGASQITFSNPELPLISVWSDLCRRHLGRNMENLAVCIPVCCHNDSGTLIYSPSYFSSPPILLHCQCWSATCSFHKWQTLAIILLFSCILFPGVGVTRTKHRTTVKCHLQRK